MRNTAFKKTPKQIEACRVLNTNTHALLVGGSRSTKTTIITRNIVLRALKTQSRHLMLRHRFNHANTSLWHDTIPKTISGFFPGLKVRYQTSNHIVQIPVQGGGGVSEIWLGGIDSKERSEKVLGNEYSTIFANEISQITYDSIEILYSRLAENSGLAHKFYYDMNPTGKKHWAYKMFVENVHPKSLKKLNLSTGLLFMNPRDNPYLPKEYIDLLDNMSEKNRTRFLLGMFQDDVEGALWTEEMIGRANQLVYNEIRRTVIAVDPAVTNNPDSDETGIIVCHSDISGRGVVTHDYSGKMSTQTWAQRVVNAYHNHNANCVVVEVNQGGDLVRDSLHNIDPSVKVEDVHASKGKFARAEPISQLYEMGLVAHDGARLGELETELTNWVPIDSKESPNRLDALVWGLTYLMIDKKAKIGGRHFGKV